MTDANPPVSAPRFWEPARLLYNVILTIVVALWIIFTWPHFRPAFTLPVLAAMLVLALIANLCYSTAYLADIALRQLPAASLRRARQALWFLGTLLALLIENYWIADEIYPDVTNGPPHPFAAASSPAAPALASNMNCPAPLAVLGFLAAAGILFAAIAAALIFWFARKPKLARRAALTLAIAAGIYSVLLLTFSAASQETVLAPGQEKYFCEIDCHLAYSILDVKLQPDGHTLITLRTRFDESTTSPTRPKDATLTPSPREVRLIDAAGHEYAPVSIQGTPLLTPLKPADSYTTELEFNLSKETSPKDAASLRLLINTKPAWPDKLVIGDENSLLHKKTYLAL